MSAEDPFRLEWAMADDIPKAQVFACFCYELTREWIRDAQRRRPDIDLGTNPIWSVGRRFFRETLPGPISDSARKNENWCRRLSQVITPKV
jgi:hypothetical protein